MDIKEVLGKNLKNIRESWGYTQAQVAELCDFEPTSYSRWENGKVWPSPETINKLAELFNCSPSFFYKDENSSPDLSSVEIGKIVEGAPFPTLLDIVFKKIQAIPDDVVEMSYYYKPSIETWDKVRDILHKDMRARLPQSTPEEIEQRKKNSQAYRQEVLRKLKKPITDK